MAISYFDVVPNPMQQARKARPFYVCVQHKLLDHLRTRIMAPLLSTEGDRRQTRLYPHLNVGDRMVILDPTDLVTIEVRHLGQPVANLSSESFRIVAALDLVFTGV